jgi:uncharacterized membrane protein
MKKNFELIDKLLYSRLFYILSTFVFIAIAFFMFSIHRVRNTSYPIDYNLFGTLGDFVGGILGTIFALISTLLVVHTFRYQQNVTNDNKRQLETQRFNDLFFELIKLYQTEVKELCGQISHNNNKDFFDNKKKELQSKFRNRNSYQLNSREALKYYMLFYIENRTNIAAYFRTIYRIYDLVDSSKLLNDDVKKNYLKIMRAQLTESELFFIRYNAMSYYGINFVKYINKYHILKHLPALEMLEFKKWWEPLNSVEKMGLNIIFDNIKKSINNAFSNDFKEGNVYENEVISTPKYNIKLIIKERFDVCISLTIDKKSKNHIIDVSSFEKMKNEDIQELFECILKEIFIFSNFGKFNKEKELETQPFPITERDEIVSIRSGIRNVKEKPLCIAYNFKKNEDLNLKDM